MKSTACTLGTSAAVKKRYIEHLQAQLMKNPLCVKVLERCLTMCAGSLEVSRVTLLFPVGLC